MPMPLVNITSSIRSQAGGQSVQSGESDAAWRAPIQPSFLDLTPHFYGPDLTARDTVRLTACLGKVKALMADGCWRTLSDISDAIGASEAGVSARLRDLRKLRFGGYAVQRRRVADGSALFEYRLTTEGNVG